MLMVSVAVCAVPFVMVTGDATVQVAGLVAPGGLVTEQVRATEPVKPPSGVTVMVPLPLLALPVIFTLMFPSLLRAKLDVLAVDPVTAAVIAAVWINSPVAASLPVMKML